MSSNKKKRALIQCRACECYCLAKDIEAHIGQIQQQSSGSPAEGNGTPKQGILSSKIQFVEIKIDLKFVHSGKGLPLRPDEKSFKKFGIHSFSSRIKCITQI
jgi:hypothetical protein